MAKKILSFLISIVAMLGAYYLIKSIMLSSPTNYLALALIDSFGVTATITGVFAFPGFVFPTHRIIGSRYYKIRNPQILVKIYKLMGISFFRILIVFFYWGAKKNRAKYFDGTKAGLQNFKYQSKQSEFGHLGSLLMIVPVSVLFLIKGFVWHSVATVGYNIIGNSYPIILQRYHRVRIEKVLNANKTKPASMLLSRQINNHLTVLHYL